MDNNSEANIDNDELRQRDDRAEGPVQSETIFHPGEKVVLRNLMRDNRSLTPRIGPFTIESVSNGNTCYLRKGDKIFKKKFHFKNLIKYYDDNDKNDTAESCDVDIENVSFSETLTRNMLFKPIGTLWMVTRCIELGIDAPNDLKCVADKCTKMLTKPKKTIDVQGDGNCWYRCVSVWVTGTEDYHEDIRAHLYNVTSSFHNITFKF